VVDGEGQHGWVERATGVTAVSLCAHCGQPGDERGDLCASHTFGGGDDWAMGNRIMCDFVHRGIVSLAPRELTDTSIEVLSLEPAPAV
jgi:hypothetical protein